MGQRLQSRGLREGRRDSGVRQKTGDGRSAVGLVGEAFGHSSRLPLPSRASVPRGPLSSRHLPFDSPTAFSVTVLFDGANGISVNRSKRLKDHERAPVAADLKHVMREKARQSEKTFALTSDVAKAHRQIPIDPRDWHLLACQVQVGRDASELSEFPPLRTSGHVCLRHSEDSANISHGLQPLRGISSSRTTPTTMQEVHTAVPR